VHGDHEARVRTGERHPRAGRSLIAKAFAFRGISAANKLSKYRDHGPGRDTAGTTRTKRARAGCYRRRVPTSRAQPACGVPGGVPPGIIRREQREGGRRPSNMANRVAEGVGFEPTRSVTRSSNFQDCRHRPLGEPSWSAQLYASGERCAALATERPGRAKSSATRAASVR
jgi:hypothetical protein